MATDMTPPVLAGAAAELNRAKRALSGKYTEEDMALYAWCVQFIRIADLRRDRTKEVYHYMGEQIWPPT